MIFAREAVQIPTSYSTQLHYRSFVRFFYIACFEQGVLVVQSLPFCSSLDAGKSEEVEVLIRIVGQLLESVREFIRHGKMKPVGIGGTYPPVMVPI